MNTDIRHTEACIRALARQEAYDLRWPARCGSCAGSGGGWSRFDPSPGGSNAPRLGPGSMEDFDTCACVDAGQCARCGEQLLGPWWRPLTIRLALSQRVHKLAAWLRYVDIPSLSRTCYWRSAALFRADPNPWTWALYHAADKLWDRIGRTPGWTGLRRTNALWEICVWLEHGYESTETPCWYCGWNWNNAAGDARDPHQCDCWASAFEAEQDEAAHWLEQERMHRAFIAGGDVATHVLTGIPGGDVLLRHIDLGMREESA